jgi:hypothetical protein
MRSALGLAGECLAPACLPRRKRFKGPWRRLLTSRHRWYQLRPINRAYPGEPREIGLSARHWIAGPDVTTAPSGAVADSYRL